MKEFRSFEWFKGLFGVSQAKRLATLNRIQEKYSIFKGLLERHNQTLKAISRVEEIWQKQQTLGLSALYEEFVKIQEGMTGVVDGMVSLGGEAYLPLKDVLVERTRQIETSFPSSPSVPHDDLVIPFAQLRADRANSVGTKNAHLGELKSALKLPVPDGFAISAWAYRFFLEHHQLQDRIARLMKDVRSRQYQHLELVSEEIRELVGRREIPGELAEAILTGYDRLTSENPGCGVALRSSALGEDATYTFAGQYQSFLNVGRDDLLARYRDILAGSFTPSAIFYLFQHGLSESGLAMGAVCMEMVDAVASGVVYTRDPLAPAGDYVVVNSIYGLGSYLVEGIITPDEFHVSRDTGKVLFSRIADKRVKLNPSRSSGVVETAVPEADRLRSSLDPGILAILADYATRVEGHFGCPQDIEWALSSFGRLFLLQTRSLKFPLHAPRLAPADKEDAKVLLTGGVPVCPGLGSGPVFVIQSVEQAAMVPHGVVLVAPNPSPMLIAAMHNISALITLVGGNASHLATLAREISLPTIGGLSAASGLSPGQVVTVDAAAGIVYEGSHAASPVAEVPVSASIPQAAAGDNATEILGGISRLTLIQPTDPNFTPQGCVTYHDILRYVHQKSMEEIYRILRGTAHKDSISLRLKTKIPLPVNIIYLDRGSLMTSRSSRKISEDDLDAIPMKAFWQGVLIEGWPSQPVPTDLKGFVAVIGTSMQGSRPAEFSEVSYAFLSKEYMLLNLRMGYHFSTIEAMTTKEPEKNYIRMQFKFGGAPLERRIRRVWLISELLRLVGFENSSQGDFLDSSIVYLDQQETCNRLTLLGRITILTKQLDLALGTDARAQWFLQEFVEKLKLKKGGG
jgi:pyruvate,water dikinase